ncbi:IS66-Spn1 transposase [Streptococcus pneumoniae]|nr:GMP synthase [Streptococcus pneumoniae]VJU94198.1 IS66-Spn1 transposase [Streptococcus pneumoniae]VJZ89207.1 IS66-Spn1 transposase [Streptococcus pneumoniae]VKP58671.1 IS66-Spn1 transposase [Streptococcus pneumoniae]VKT37168.1 IS66-Spn1 transposase [Streptococcus pneumoniae]
MYDYLVVVLVSLVHSFGSVSIIAHTIHQKFNLKVPNYRQEED